MTLRNKQYLTQGDFSSFRKKHRFSGIIITFPLIAINRLPKKQKAALPYEAPPSGVLLFDGRLLRSLPPEAAFIGRERHPSRVSFTVSSFP